jgi:O-antigen/teichoic acid export membrane protein
MNHVHKEMARGAAWLTALRMSERGLGLINTVVLARLLTPQDFGVVAMCMVVVAALEAFTSFGFDVVLIQRQDAKKEQYDTAFTLNAILGLVVGGLLIASGSLVAWFYSDVRLTPIMYVVGANFFIRSLENIAIVDFRKHFQFHLEAILRISVKAVGLATTIPAAFYLHTYWALVIGMTATTVADVVLSYAMRPYRPVLTLAATRSIMNFSGWLMFNNVIFFIRTQIHTVFIGRLLGPKALGTFNMAYEIAMMSSSELIAPINRAVYPGYAKLSNDIAAFRATFLDVFSLIVIVSLPAALGTAAIADALAPLLLGSAWLETVPLIKLIALCGALNTLNSNMAYVIHALGQPRLATRIAIYDAVLMVPILFVAITWFGIIGAAWSLIVSYAFISTPLWWRTIGRLLELPTTRILSRLWRPTIAAISMYLVVVSLQLTVLSDLSRPLAIGIAIGAGVIAYVGTLGMLWRLNGLPRGGEAILLDFIRQRMIRVGSSPATGI